MKKYAFRPWKKWRVRFHLNRFASTFYKEVDVEAKDRGHALMLACMQTMHEPWAKRVLKSTARRV